MTRRTLQGALLLTGILLISACGGSSGSPAASVDGGGGTATDAAQPTDAAAPPTDAAAPPTDAGSGGGTTGDFAGKVCDLITLEEMSGATAMAPDSVDEQPFTAGSGTCGYNAGATPVGAVTLVGGSTTDSNVPWNIYTADASSEAVPVNGAEAIWYANANSAIVHKNGYLGTILLLAPKDGDAKAAATSLLQTLADRMP